MAKLASGKTKKQELYQGITPGYIFLKQRKQQLHLQVL